MHALGPLVLAELPDRLADLTRRAPPPRRKSPWVLAIVVAAAAAAVVWWLRRDRSPSKAVQVSDFGLVIVTRKRVKQSLERQLTEPCPYCSGSGSIKSSSTICFEILTELKKIGSDLEGNGVVLRVNPDIARALKERR